MEHVHTCYVVTLERESESPDTSKIGENSGGAAEGECTHG